MKVIIFGSNGLLGNTITKYFLDNSSYETFPILRDSSKIMLFKKKYHKSFIVIKNILDFEEIKKKIKNIRPDILINCIGITNKVQKNNTSYFEDLIRVNSLFPHMLHRISLDLNARLIHLSTDCIYSGNKGNYNENDLPDPIDAYGRSKLLGELNYENTLTIRKSVVGHEFLTKKGLLEWFLDQNKIVQGYKNVIFSGLTVLELARLIDIYIIPRNDLKGIFHVSGEPISKFDLLKIFNEIYNKSIKIVPNESIKINRTLNGSHFNKVTGYKINSWSSLIKSMYEFNLLNL